MIALNNIFIRVAQPSLINNKSLCQLRGPPASNLYWLPSFWISQQRTATLTLEGGGLIE